MTGACIIGQVMEKIVEQGLLYDFYGSLLTMHQQKIYEKVVYENLSLNEVAETEGVSKQAVHDLVRRCTAIMRGYEEKLGMIHRFGKIRESAGKLRKMAEASYACAPLDAADIIYETMKRILRRDES